MKSLRLNKDGFKRCRNPFCRKKITPTRKDQRFCLGKNCKQEFFSIDYGLRALAKHFEFTEPMRRRKRG